MANVSYQQPIRSRWRLLFYPHPRFGMADEIFWRRRQERIHFHDLRSNWKGCYYTAKILHSQSVIAIRYYSKGSLQSRLENHGRQSPHRTGHFGMKDVTTQWKSLVTTNSGSIVGCPASSITCIYQFLASFICNNVPVRDLYTSRPWVANSEFTRIINDRRISICSLWLLWDDNAYAAQLQNSRHALRTVSRGRVWRKRKCGS